MKKKCLIIACVLTLLLCACGSSDASVDSTDDAGSAAAGGAGDAAGDTGGAASEPSAQPSPAASAEPSPEPSEEPQPDEESGSDLKEIALGYMGKSVSELFAAIGQPSSSDYAPSCLGAGEDGNLYYDGFIVYTYREGDVETVEYVE